MERIIVIPFNLCYNHAKQDGPSSSHRSDSHGRRPFVRYILGRLVFIRPSQATQQSPRPRPPSSPTGDISSSSSITLHLTSTSARSASHIRIGTTKHHFSTQRCWYIYIHGSRLHLAHRSVRGEIPTTKDVTVLMDWELLDCVESRLGDNTVTETPLWVYWTIGS